MMGQQNRAQTQFLLGQCTLDDIRITGIDGNRIAAVVVQQPDVIVGQRR
jgi:hypothetical protein